MQTLLIDDNSTSVFLTEMLLKRESFSNKIHSFLAAQDALRFLAQSMPTQVPDIIFLDLNMPVMDGWEFLDALKPYEDTLTTRCRIYVLTSSLDPADATRAQEYALVSGLIHKPIDKHILHVIQAEISEQTRD